ncbi:MAG: hypothetical protein KJO07_26000 [Deltaproteobacteria bacterium]|nr:hypothetical protein [Deltaproteobacteria bacterium]
MPRLYAHRGAAAELPENTLPSFERALEVGADALEMDVHLTADGEVVVSHDPDGERMAGVDRNIADCELAEIKTWDLGYGFTDEGGGRSYAGQGFEMPTLAEVLERFEDVIINVDLKPQSPALVDAAMAIIAGHGAENRVQLASFHWQNLVRVRLRGYTGLTAMAPPEIAIAFAGPGLLVRRLPLLGNAAQIPSHREFLAQQGDDVGLVLGTSALSGLPGGQWLSELPKKVFPSDRWVVNRLRRLEVRIDFWTINDPEEARALAALGADGIMTDDPRTIAVALGKAPTA